MRKRDRLVHLAADRTSRGAQHGDVTPNLSREEDAILRRLHWFERFGIELSPAWRVMKALIRSRDKRSLIRDPHEVTLIAEPVEKPIS